MAGADIPDQPAAILGRPEAEAIIARRLRALGHPPGYLDSLSRAQLVAHAAGSPRRLRAGLAAVLFLASTEDAPAIDAGLVQRALQASPGDPPAPRAHAGPRVPIVPVAFGIAVTTLLVAILTWQPHHRAPRTRTDAPPTSLTRQPTREAAPDLLPPMLLPPNPQPAPGPAGPAEPPAPGTANATAQAPTPMLLPPPPAQPGKPQPLPPLPPAIAVGELPLPHADQTPAYQTRAEPPAPATFAEPPATVASAVLLIYPARSPAALARLRPLALALQHAGFTSIRARPSHVIPTRRAISFFYSEDAARAQLIADMLAGSGWPRLDSNSLQPSLVLVPSGLPPRSPGEIEVQLP